MTYPETDWSMAISTDSRRFPRVPQRSPATPGAERLAARRPPAVASRPDHPTDDGWLKCMDDKEKQIISNGLEPDSDGLPPIEAMASNLEGTTSNLIAMASNKITIASNLIAMASNLMATVRPNAPTEKRWPPTEKRWPPT